MDPRIHQCIALDPMGRLTAPLDPPNSIVFAFANNRCAHIFSVLSLDMSAMNKTSMIQQIKPKLKYNEPSK